MKQIRFGQTEEEVSAVALGCMRLNQAADPVKVIETAVEQGINFVDHADIYGEGQCETIFKEALSKTSISRDQLFIQTKAGIDKAKKTFDFSKEYLTQAIEGSMRRLGVDYLDSFLLHRPDTLFEAEEVAEVFTKMHKEGKIRYFGVSNQNVGQVELLKSYLDQPLQANQLQFGLKHTQMIDQGIYVNMEDSRATNRDGGILEYSRHHQMTIQAWSPYQYGYFEGVFIGNDNFKDLNRVLDKIAPRYTITPTGLATAWILRHPANMQVIAGTMTPDRIKQIADASSVKITRQEWYELYQAAGNELP